MKTLAAGIVYLCSSLSAGSTAWSSPPETPDWVVRGQSNMVAADSEYASKAGLEILRAGGNAFDAAAAVSFALAVTRPYSTGLGGGGFLIGRLADGRIVVQDFRETAPAAATSDMFVKAKELRPNAPSPSEFGYLAVAIPGLVAGRCQALTLWGTMPLAETLRPAIRLAREGFPVDEDYVRVSREVVDTYDKHPSLKESCDYVYRTHLRGGVPRKPGDVLVQPQLGHLFEQLALKGPDLFYRGPVAEAIAREMKRHGGIVAEADLAAYAPKLREPVISTYRDYKLVLMPSPSSGGIALAQTLNILETLDFASAMKNDAPLAVHYQVEAMKHAFADRAQWLGDQDFVELPIERLLSKSYARALARDITPDRVSEIGKYGSLGMPKDAGTSHFSIADRFGNVVVSTETINTSFGSLAAIDEWGLILNNEMDDFTAEPGKPNAFGLVQSDRNAIAPGKRPLSSMTPTIVLKGDKPFLLLGASGGPRIISSVLNVLLGVVDRELSLEGAILARRPHHQWQPDTVFFDGDPPNEWLDGLRKRSHTIAEKRRTGIVQAILRTTDGWVGASDPRKGGRPAGE